MKCFHSKNPALCSVITTIVIGSLFSFLFLMMFFAHLHILPDGRIILHSHAIPFSENGKTSHSHSQTSLLFLHIFLSGFVLFLFAVFELARKIRIGRTFLNKKNNLSTRIYSFLNGLRAPPAFGFCPIK